MRKSVEPEPIIAVIVLFLIMMMMVWAIVSSTPDPNCKPEYIGHVIQIGATCRQ